MFLNGDLTPIGGYFGLELPAQRDLLHSGLRGFQSARAAFLALLLAGKPKKVWMPRYICNSMLAPLWKAGIECAWYDLTDALEVEDGVKLKDGEWLLYVNYFGLCGAKVETLMQRIPPAQVVVDYSQSFFSPPHRQALATIYSPRKFFGLPDGGLLYSQIPVPPPDETASTSFMRMEHLLKRLEDSPEAGYTAYLKAEESLNDLEPKRMSQLTERILGSIDFESVRKIRKRNFKNLMGLLGENSMITGGMNEADVPLCYPYRSSDLNLRDRLTCNRIYVATYWTDALDRLNTDQANRLVRDFFPIPIDQRYTEADMKRIASIITGKE